MPRTADLIKAHQGQPFATANCVQCHNPHQSAQPKLMQTFTHPPFASGELRHLPRARQGRQGCADAELTRRPLCVTCHSEQAEKIEKAKVQHPGAQGDCITCHNPHAGKTPGFIAARSGRSLPDLPQRAGGCSSRRRIRHQPAFQQGCATCHEPHGGNNPKLLRVQGNALVPGVPRPRDAAAEARIRARTDHHLQWAGEAARRLFREEQGMSFFR